MCIRDRLYFEPLTEEDVLRILEVEKPVGVVVAFGGQTAIRLTQALDRAGINILGTSAEGIDIAEDRARFDALLERFSIRRPKGMGVRTLDEALAAAQALGYPVLQMCIRDSYEGESFGAEADGLGELVFTTGMTGYIETLTDPSYAGQIIMQTFPLIGNYGIIDADFEGNCLARGYVVREWCDAPSNFRCQGTVDAFLKARGIPGICGVDTRAITRRIREQGVMNALICRRVPDDLSLIHI